MIKIKRKFRNRPKPKASKHPWKKHNPGIFKKKSYDCIVPYLYDRTTEIIKRRMRKQEYAGARVKQCIF